MNRSPSKSTDAPINEAGFGDKLQNSLFSTSTEKLQNEEDSKPSEGSEAKRRSPMLKIKRPPSPLASLLLQPSSPRDDHEKDNNTHSNSSQSQSGVVATKEKGVLDVKRATSLREQRDGMKKVSSSGSLSPRSALLLSPPLPFFDFFFNMNISSPL